ncbi:MAG: TRAP transporter large permease [Geminicoccaceae bacterium]|nr:MAG: TRAP transporter large permease [Geminicoccaceae bacterium]
MLPLLVILGLFLLIGTPVAFAMALAGLWALDDMGTPLGVLVNRMASGPDSFVLLAIPFFMMAGELMNRSGMTHQLVRLATASIGRTRGALGHANVLASILFAGKSGTAVGDVAALGSIFVPAMEKEGYDRRFAAAVTAASSLIGPIIPPSIILVIYGSIVGVSIGGLFAAGIVPGLLLAVSCFVIVYIQSLRRGYPRREERITVGEYARIFGGAVPALLMPVILLGGIFSGVFTATEAACVAVIYAFLVAFVWYREIRLRDLGPIFFIAGLRSAVVLMIIAAAAVLGWLFSTMGVPRAISGFLLSIVGDPILIMFIVIGILLVIGTILEPGAAVILLAPILAPVLHQLGFEPLVVGVIIVMTLNIGLCTPPVGAVLFTAQSVSGVRLEQILRDIWPFLLAQVVVLVLLVLFPGLVTWMPQALGFR